MLLSLSARRFLFVFATMIMGESWAQPTYSVKGKVYIEEGIANGILLTVTETGKSTHVEVDGQGQFSANLSWDKVYFFKVSKPGYVSKVVEFSTIVPPSVSKAAIAPYELQIKLFKVFDGVDSMFFKNPVAKIAFDVRISDFGYDTDYSLSVMNHIDRMRQNGVSTLEKKFTSDKTLSSNTPVVPKSTIAATRVLKEEPSTVPYINPSKNKQNDASKNSKIIPELKPYYPLGRTVEEYVLENKAVTRVVVKGDNRQKVLLMVKHEWGATYYFVDETPLTIRCVSKAVFERETLLRTSEK